MVAAGLLVGTAVVVGAFVVCCAGVVGLNVGLTVVEVAVVVDVNVTVVVVVVIVTVVVLVAVVVVVVVVLVLEVVDVVVAAAAAVALAVDEAGSVVVAAASLSKLTNLRWGLVFASTLEGSARVLTEDSLQRPLSTRNESARHVVTAEHAPLQPLRESTALSWLPMRCPVWPAPVAT